MSLTTQSLGYICGPIVGGSLFDAYGFRGTTDILMVSAVILSIVYYLLNIRPIKLKPEEGYRYSELDVHED